jgi:hypothetical protein
MKVRKFSPQRCRRCKGTGRAWVNPYSDEFHPKENEQLILIRRHILFTIPASVATTPGLLDMLMLADRLADRTERPFSSEI